MGIKLYTHHSWQRLEAALWEDLARLKRDDPLWPLALLTPTASLADNLKRRAGALFPALLNVYFFHYLSLEYQILRWAQEAALVTRLPKQMPPAVEEQLAEICLQERQAGALNQYLQEVPAARSSLLATFRDLRDCGLTGDSLAKLMEGKLPVEFSSEEQELFHLYVRYNEGLEKLQRHGLLDDAGLANQCRDWLPALKLPFTHLLHYGAYELTGSRRGLVERLSRHVEVLVYAPSHPEAAPFGYARRAMSRSFPAAIPEPLPEQNSTGRHGDALAQHIYSSPRGSAIPVDLKPDFIKVAHAQGAESEVAFVARRILALHSAGVPLDEIGVTARSLAPYASALSAVFAAHRIPMTSTATLPLLRWPRARAFVQLVNVFAGGFERGAVMGLLGSSFFRFGPFLPRGLQPNVDAWDRWTRRAGIVDGYESWKRKLSEDNVALEPDSLSDDADVENSDGGDVALEYVTYRHQQTNLLFVVLEALNEEAIRWKKASTWLEHERFLGQAAERFLEGFSEAQPVVEEEVAAVQEILGAMRDMHFLASIVPPPGIVEVSRWVSEHLAKAETRLAPRSSGVRILDFMQARGHQFRILFIIGFNAELFPRQPRSDLFLADDTRRKIASTAGLPLLAKMEGHDEEHLLLALLVGSAAEQIVLTYRRADEEGGTLLPSSAFREISRAITGNPDPSGFLEQATRIPLHPVEVGDFYASETELVAPAEALVSVAARPGAGVPVLQKQAVELGCITPALEAGILAQRALESTFPDCLDYDGLLPAPAGQLPVFSPSSLERLGKCPLVYFFQDTLGVRELEEPLLAHEMDALEFGLCAHKLLRGIYAQLRDKGLLGQEAQSLASVYSEALSTLESLWEEAWRAPRLRIGDAYPLLWQAIERQWRSSLELFLQEDLVRLQKVNGRRFEFELEMKGHLNLRFGEKTRSLQLKGRADRVVWSAGGVDDPEPGVVTVGDYKTGRNLKLSPTEILRGNTLQLPVYLLLAEQRQGGMQVAVKGELLGIGPKHADSRPLERYKDWDLPAPIDSRRKGIEETLAVLQDCRQQGRFPFHHDERSSDKHCRYCVYRPACRRNHLPSRQRVERAAEFQSYFALKSKERAR